MVRHADRHGSPIANHARLSDRYVAKAEQPELAESSWHWRGGGGEREAEGAERSLQLHCAASAGVGRPGDLLWDVWLWDKMLLDGLTLLQACGTAWVEWRVAVPQGKRWFV